MYTCFHFTFTKFSAPPVITAITPDLSPMPGSKVTLWCNATGSPTPTITWQRVRPVRSFPSPPGGAFSTGSQLVIGEITGDWRGLYQCVASNGIRQEGEVFLQMECEYSMHHVIRRNFLRILTLQRP